MEVSGGRDNYIRANLAPVVQCQHGAEVMSTNVCNCRDFVLESTCARQKRLNIAAKDGSWCKRLLCRSRVMVLPEPIEKMIWLVWQGADLSRGYIQQVAHAWRRIGQAKAEIRPRVDEDDSCWCPLPNQMDGRECPAYSTTDDCDCPGYF